MQPTTFCKRSITIHDQETPATIHPISPAGKAAVRAASSSQEKSYPSGPTVADIVARKFVAELPRTLQALRLALTTGDLPGALDAAAILKVTAHEAGAEDLENLASELACALRREETSEDPSTVLPALASTHLNVIGQQVRRYTYLFGDHRR